LELELQLIFGKEIRFGDNESQGSMPIVFVHLNGKIPKYLQINLKSTIHRFPKNQVVLIINEISTKIRITGLTVYKYEEDSKWKILHGYLSHPKNFRNNFWMISIARFFALEQLMQNYKNEIIHIESDVFLSNDFPFKLFANLEKTISFPIVSKERGVSSTLYIKNLKIIQKLNDFAITEAHRNSQTSDMLILRKFYDQFKNQIEVLPIGPAIKECYKESLDSDLFSKMMEGITHFKGVFDGNDIGVYFFGTNPENLRGKTILGKTINFNYANVENWVPIYNSKRNFMDLKIQGEEQSIPIYSIHATVKSSSVFSIEKQKQVIELRLKQSKDGERSELIHSVFMYQIFKYIKKQFLRKGE